MEIRQIQYFLTVAKYSNFTTAASELHISQSTLSRQITAMENELNLLLFMRDNRNVALTKCGEYLYAEFSKLYNTYFILVENSRQIFQGFSGTLKFGILDEITLKGLMQQTLDKHLKEYPNHTIDMARGSFQNLSTGIVDMSYDFIVTLLFDISRIPGLKYKIIDKHKEGIILSAKNPLSKKDFFYPPDFKNDTFILISREESLYTMDNAIAFCKSYGFYPKIKIAPNLTTAMLWVEAGLGLAFTYSNSVAAHNPSMKFIPFKSSDSIPESQLVLVYNPQKQNPAIDNFIHSFIMERSKLTI